MKNCIVYLLGLLALKVPAAEDFFQAACDEARAVARFGINGALTASALMFTLDDVPLLYNGMEAGDATESGDPALFGRMPVFLAS